MLHPMCAHAQRHFARKRILRVSCSRVNLNQELEVEVRYWAHEFDCTEEQLREAVSRVGRSADRVREAVRVIRKLLNASP